MSRGVEVVQYRGYIVSAAIVRTPPTLHDLSFQVIFDYRKRKENPLCVILARKRV
jgi:hypothetical protein